MTTTVLVVGPPGVGKTRMIQAWKRKGGDRACGKIKVYERYPRAGEPPNTTVLIAHGPSARAANLGLAESWHASEGRGRLVHHISGPKPSVDGAELVHER